MKYITFRNKLINTNNKLVLYDDSLDLDALLFIENAAITNQIQKMAINVFVKDLKSINNILPNFVNFTTPSNSIIKAIYPYIGGNATSHKYNLLNPLDSDDAFRLDFNGTITHSVLGIKGDGSTGYFDTHLIPSTILTLNNIFLAHYALGNYISLDRYSLGVRSSTDQKLFFSGLISGYKGAGHCYNSNSGFGYIESAESWQIKDRLQYINRYNGKYNIGCRGIKSTENTNTGGTQPTLSIKGLCIDNEGTKILFDNRQYTLHIIGSGLSDDAILALSNACDNFQKNLSRYPYRSLMVFDGDSLTYGLREGCTESYPTQLVNKFTLPNTILSYNYGISGQKLSDMITDASSQIDILYDSAKDYNIVFIWGGVNDLGLELSTTAEQVYDRLKTYCQGRKEIGFKVYALTMLPQSVITYVSRITYEADRQIFNNLVRTDLINSGYCDGIIDIAADNRIGLSGCELDTTYYLTDKIHMNNTGYGVVSDIAYNKIKFLFNL
ncbi:MAG: SGNH/GDSL hydrolase family protein [Candidatus Nanoarchaeia archaeon]|nr:SGNH/GDSL hydrolase family protein [Candidatus Nanoarchaeia archaeon]